MARGSVVGRDPYLKGKTRLFRRYEVVVELGRQPVRMHTVPSGAGTRLSGVRL